MAEIEDLDSGQKPVDGGTTSPAGSQTGGGQQSSFDAAKLQSSLEAIAKRLDEVDARSKSLQGDKDRGVNKANKEVDDLKKKIAELEKYRKAGYDDDAALEEMSFRESVAQVKDQIAKLNPAPAGNGAVDVAKVNAKLQVDPASPDIIALANRSWKSEDEYELAVYRHKAGTPQPNGADTSAPPAPPPQRSASYEEQAREMELLVKNYSKNAARIEQLEKEMRAAQK